MEGISVPVMDWSAGDLPAAWRAFRRHVDFIFGGPLKGKSEEEKCNYLMLWVGDVGRNVHSTWTLTAEESKKLDSYFTRFQAHVQPKANPVFARFRMTSRVQGVEEPFDTFVTDLKLLVKDCSYPNPDKMVRDGIVFGTNSAKVREKLINVGSELTLEKAVDVGRLHEISKAQLQSMAVGLPGGEQTVNKLSGGKTTSKASHQCGKCGGRHNFKDKEACPAKGKECRKCKQEGHFARVCRTRRNTGQRVHGVDNSSGSDSDDDVLFVGAVYDVNSLAWWETVQVCGTNVRFQLDTGARCNVMSKKTVPENRP